MNPNLVDLLRFLASGILLVGLGGILLAWGWALRRTWQGRGLLDDLPGAPLTEAPWGVGTILAVVVLFLLVNLSVTYGYETVTGHPSARHRKAPPAQAKADPAGKPAARPAGPVHPEPAAAAPGPEKDAEEPTKPKDANQEAKTESAPGADPLEQTETEQLIQLAIINLILPILVLALVRITSGARLQDLGLHTANLKGQVMTGVVAALLTTPAVLAIQSLAVRFWPSQKHPVDTMMRDAFSPGVAVLAIMSTMILAPMVEELLFRGILQRWLTRLLDDRLVPSETSSLSDVSTDPEPWLTENANLEFASDTANTKAPVPSGAPTSVLAIVMTSLFFAAMHFPQWPAPIGIFLLSVALGVVFQRTGSLIAVMTMHGVFNGFSTVGLLVLALEQQVHPEHIDAAHALCSLLFCLY